MKNVFKNFKHWPLVVLLIVFMLLAALYSLTIPLDAAPDEREHFDLVRYIAEQKRPPLNNAERDSVGYKGDASPLYHGLVALSSQYVDVEPLPDTHVLGVPELFIPFDNILDNRILHTENEIIPFKGIVLAWHLARLATIPLAAATMVAIYFTSLAIYPVRQYFALGAAAFAAFLPRFMINSAVINDDNLVIPFTAFAIYFLVRVLQGDTKHRTLLWLGIFIGLATITKYHALVLLPEMTVAFAVMAWIKQRNWKPWLRRWAWAMLGFVIAAGGWLAFLIIRFNRVSELGLIRGIMDPLGDPVITDSSSMPVASYSLAWDWIGPLFRSFWMALEGTRVFAPESIYWIFGLITLIAVFGLGRWLYTGFKQKSAWQPGIVLLALHFFIYLAIVFVRYQTRAAMGLGYAAAPHNIQGRHLYPALISVAFFCVLGLTEAVRAWPWLFNKLQRLHLDVDKFVAISVSGTLIILGVLSFFYFIRPTYLPYLPITTLNPQDVLVTYPIDTKIIEGTKLIGYNLKIPPPTADLLPVTLYWHSRTNPERDYLIELCLVDTNGDTVSCFQGHPAGGLFPTRSWTAGDIIRDEVNIPLPHCLPSGVYELTLTARLLQDDVAATVVDETKLVESFSLGKIELTRTPSTADGDVFVCTQNGCQAEGEFVLPQIRSGVSLVNIKADTQPPADELAQFISGKNKWFPLEKTVTYRCPDGEQATTYTFIADRSVTPGLYQLEIDNQLGASLQVDVKTSPRDFDLPAAMQNELAISYADKLELLGYDIDLSPRYPDEPIEAALYWQAKRTTDRNYVATLHLLDNQMTMWGQTDHEVGGLYPNILWAPGEVVRDVHTLQNPGVMPGLYTVELVLYDSTNGFQPLPKALLPAGEFMPHNPVLGQIRILDPVRIRPPGESLRVNLNDEIELLGYDLIDTQLTKNEPLSLALHWQASKPPTANYTVFTQLIGPDGQVWAQKDNPPQGGRYPTTIWEVGDRVVDRFELSLNEGAPVGEYRLLVGMYDWTTGQRLPTLDENGNRLPDDAIQLTSIIVEDVPNNLP